MCSCRTVRKNWKKTCTILFALGSFPYHLRRTSSLRVWYASRSKPSTVTHRYHCFSKKSQPPSLWILAISKSRSWTASVPFEDENLRDDTLNKMIRSPTLPEPPLCFYLRGVLMFSTELSPISPHPPSTTESNISTDLLTLMGNAIGCSEKHHIIRWFVLIRHEI